ncbi:MAG: glycosyltransferase, partial [Elusimicrobia bacterium]|nr:glycosyltransferase [Elusimicrobiota bacterium]
MLRSILFAVAAGAALSFVPRAAFVLGVPARWFAAAATLAGAQLAAAALFRLRARTVLPLPSATGEGRGEGSSTPPSLCVIVPCKGAPPPFEECIRSLLEQDYPGRIEWRFVIADAGDPARPALERLCAAEPRAKLIISGAEPKRSSAKALSLLAGVDAVGTAEILLFADADAVVAPDWAARMAAALDDRTALATAVSLPRVASLSAAVRLAWLAFGTAWFEPMGLAAGHSMALRRADFDRWGVKELWQHSVSDDLALCYLAAEHGRVRLVPGATPEAREAPGPGSGPPGALVSQSSRWLTLFRFYRPDVWWLGLAATLIKLCALSETFRWPGHWTLPAVILGGDAAATLIVLWGLRGARGARSGADALLAAAASPLLYPLYAAGFVVSAFWREIVWSGWTYALDGPAAVKGSAAAGRSRRLRAARLLAAALGGAAFGLAYRDGPWWWL